MAGEIGFFNSDPNAMFKGAANMNQMLQRITKRKAGAAMAKGDFKGGLDTLRSDGMLEEADQAQQSQDVHIGQGDVHEKRLFDIGEERRKKSTQMVHDVATSLDNIRSTQGDQAVLPAFEHLVPVFKHNGATDEEIAMYRQQLQNNPGAFLAGVIDHTKDYRAVQTGTGGIVIWNSRTGRFEQKYQGPQYKTVGPGQDLIELPGDQQGDGFVDPNAGPQIDPNAQPMDEINRGAPVMSGDPGMTMQGPQTNDHNEVQAPNTNDHMMISPRAVAQVESGGNPNAVSPKGALGTMQTMPGTLQSPGFGVAPAKDGSPEEKTRVGQEYLGALQEKYGNPIAALIAYNWGPGNTDKWIADGADLTKLPRETQQYIMKVAGAQSRLPRPQAAAPTPTSAPAPAAGNAPAAAQPGPQLSGGAKVIARGQRQEWRNMSADELKQRGYSPGAVVQINDTTKQERMTQRAPTNSNTGGNTKLSPQDNSTINKLRTEAKELGTMSSLLDEFMGINKKAETGGSYALHPFVPGVAAAMGNSDVGRMQAITDQITPAMRNGLPGAASDRDVSMFRGATVGVEKPYETNRAIAIAQKALARRSADYIAFMEAYARKKGGLLGAQELWDAYKDDNPLFKEGKNGPITQKVVPWREVITELKDDAPAAKGGDWEYLGAEQ